MAIFPSGKRTRSPREKYQTVAMVIGPSLPIYIITMESSLAATPSPGVMPVESPTVPKALTISNSASRKASCGSKSSSTKVLPATRNSPMEAMTDALRNASAGRV